mgnify:FL=1|tara:strand:- start:1896 stop:2144 length:249 start_codon:yes stop_codon:yes gene_type:complete
MNKKNCTKITIPKLLVKPVGRVINDFIMIRDVDKILLAVSGSKDSLSLFRILREEKRTPNLYKNLLSAMRPMLDETKGMVDG